MKIIKHLMQRLVEQQEKHNDIIRSSKNTQEIEEHRKEAMQIALRKTEIRKYALSKNK